MEEKDISEEFDELVTNLDDNIFWEYVRSWKDETDLIEQMKEWDDETKEEAIEEIKELIKEKDKKKKLSEEKERESFAEDRLVALNTPHYAIEVKETDEGVIIDVFHRHGDLIDTYTYWNDDVIDSEVEK